jgi:hypothetical protein
MTLTFQPESRAVACYLSYGRRFFVGLCLFIFAAGALHAQAGRTALTAVDDRWRHYKSPNFELYSHTDDTSSRELLRNLEILRALFIDRFKTVERKRLDVTIYSFSAAEDFRAYADESIRKNDDVKGFYQAGPVRAVISLSPMETEDGAQRLIFHEYIHHLFRLTEADPPTWYNEGMAELLAGIRIENDKVEIGHPPSAGRIITLQNEKLLPLETLFSVENDSPLYRGKDHAGIFYAESWALLHYWNFGQSKIPKAAVDRFLRIARNDKLAKLVNLRTLFRECFAMDYPDMVRQLEKYVNSGTYKYGKEPIPPIAPPASYVMRAVGRDEIKVRLAELAIRSDPSGVGKVALLDAATGTPADSRALEALGTAALHAGEPDLAMERWEAAVTAGSQNPAVVRELSLMESRQWMENFNYDFHLPLERAERLRARLAKSIEYEPLQSEAYEMLAWVEAYSTPLVAKNVNLVQQNFHKLKHRDRTLVALSFMRLRANLPDQTKEMLTGLDKLECDTWSLQAAEDIRARMEGRLPQRVTSRSSDSGTMVDLAENSGNMLRVPSVKMPPRP